MLQKTTQIKIQDYISNDEVAKSVITDFTTNKFITKGSTGIGGTSAIFNITNQTVIIISPLTGMIKGKELNREDHHLYIYQGSRDKWSNAIDRMSRNQDTIINTTPEQIIELNKNNPFVFNKIIQQKCFVDESHIAAEANYRPALAEFMDILFTRWENKFILSTATPAHNYLDIPQHISAGMQFFNISRLNEPKKELTVYDYNNYQSFVVEEYKKNRKVVIFTNNLQVIKNITTQIPNNEINYLLGDILNVKAKTAKLVTEEEGLAMEKGLLDSECNVFILSTKFLTGFDIPFDASVAIIANYNHHNQTDNKTINDIVQAYGRVRGNVLSAGLFYNADSFVENNSIQYYQNLIFSGDSITQNIAKIELIKTYTDQDTLINNLTKLNFNVSVNEKLATVIPSGLTINHQIEFVRNVGPIVLKTDVNKILNRIGGDDDAYNGYSTKMIVIFCAAYISQLAENEWLDETLSRLTEVNRIIFTLKRFIDTNSTDNQAKYKFSDKEINDTISAGGVSKSYQTVRRLNLTMMNCEIAVNHLYVIAKMNNQSLLTSEDKNKIEMLQTITSVITSTFNKWAMKTCGLSEAALKTKIVDNCQLLNIYIANNLLKSNFKNCIRDIINNLSFIPTEDELKYIDLYFTRGLNSLLKQPQVNPMEEVPFFDIRARLRYIDYSVDNQIKLHKIYILGLLSFQVSDHMFGFKRTSKDNREYNLVTKLPRYLRYKYTPYPIQEVDIVAANAQFIDKKIGSNIATEVYANLENNLGITRNEAKVIYNSTLNNYKLPKKAALDVYLKCGYTPTQAATLTDLSCGKKIFYLMAEMEKDIIDKYRAGNQLKAIRCHDALIMLSNELNAELPTDFLTYKFNITKY